MLNDDVVEYGAWVSRNSLFTLSLGRFSVIWICSRTRYWPACVKLHAADDKQFRVSVFYGLRDSVDNRLYNTVSAPRPSLKLLKL
jgi:hypothetical protein